MLSRYWYWGVAVDCVGALVAGCHSMSSRSGRGSPAGAELAAGQGDPPTDKVAEAHAHYAMGVVHELNDEADAALDEYYRAAAADPGDESLVLEVSRRLLQKK